MKKIGLEHHKDWKTNTEYSNNRQDVYKNIDEHNLGKMQKILIVLDDMIVDIIVAKKLNPIANELFIKGRKWSISLAFITQL